MAAKRHIFITYVNTFWQMILIKTLLEGKKDVTDEILEDAAELLRSYSNMISAEIPSGLEEITRKIIECNNKDEFFNMPPSLAKQWLKTHCPEAMNLLSKFLIAHGHRSLKELDFYTETWGMNSTQLLVHLQNLVKGGLRKQIKPSVRIMGEIIAKLKTPKKSSTRKALNFISPFCGKTAEQREIAKNALLRIIHSLRVAFNKLGNLMVKENYLPEQKCIFFCSFYEIKKLLATRNHIILHKALRRQRLWEQWHNLQFPELMKTLPLPVSRNIGLSEENENIRLKGTLVFPGRVTGRACVVLDLCKSLEVQTGDILITVSTDVGWTPLFPLLSGVVTELGGLISHEYTTMLVSCVGAVVAREYGVPCLVGATSATTLFKTGDQVVLDGPNSSIYKLTQ